MNNHDVHYGDFSTTFLRRVRHTVRDSIIFLFSVTGIIYWYRSKILRKGPLVRVIALHDVPNREWFESFATLLTRSYSVLTPKEFVQGAYSKDSINILLTFDDGYDSWVHVVAPVLRAHGVRALFFINSGLLDVALQPDETEKFMRDRLRLRVRKPLTWEGARALIADGHTIGGHTYSHQSLPTLEVNEATEEIIKDKTRLETELGVTPTDFAYPFGTSRDMNSVSERILKEHGYTYLYSAETGFALVGNCSRIPRTLIDCGQPFAQVRRWIAGGYDIFARMVKGARHHHG